MFCKNCGEVVHDGELFCSNCGNRIKALNTERMNDLEKKQDEQVRKNTVITNNNMNKENSVRVKKKRTLKPLIIIALLIIISIISVFVVVQYFNNAFSYDTNGAFSHEDISNDEESIDEETTEEITRHTVPLEILNNSLSGFRVSVGPFTISLDSLINQAMTDYEIEYLQGEEIIQNGYLSSDYIDSESNIDNYYCAIISGDTMQNPELPYLTNYEEKAVVAIMQYNDNDELVDSSLRLCQNLETCAILLTTTGY